MTRFVYVVAHSYSGTTLLSLLLDRHPEIATIGEMEGVAAGIDIESYECSCGELIRVCPFWSTVADGMRRRGFDFRLDDFDTEFRDPTRRLADRIVRAGTHGATFEMLRSVALRLVPAARRARDRVLERNEALVDVITGIRGRAVFVDISKRPGRLAHLRHASSFDIRVIHMVRDPRAVAHSCMRNLGISAAEASRSWARHLRESEVARGLVSSSRWLTLKHEDLCENPDAALRGVHRFIGVTETACADLPTVVHHVIGNRMRLGGSTEIRRDDRWKSALDTSDLRTCADATGALARRYGYSHDIAAT